MAATGFAFCFVCVCLSVCLCVCACVYSGKLQSIINESEDWVTAKCYGYHRTCVVLEGISCHGYLFILFLPDQ